MQRDMEKAEEERRKSNIIITPVVREEIYAEVFGVEKRNRVRGLGAGVRWCDVPYIHTEKRHVSKTIEAMQATLEEQRLETARIRSEAEKERVEAAQREERIRAEAEEYRNEAIMREERIRAEAAEREQRFTDEIDKFRREQLIIMQENAKMVEQKAAIQLGRWMKEAGFSGINTATQGNVEPTTQVTSTQP